MISGLRRIFSNGWLLLACRLFLGTLFLYAGISKAGDPEEFIRSVRVYNILPDFITPAFAVGILWIEIYCGALLIAGLFTESAALVIDGMLVVFIIAISINIARGNVMECGCFDFFGLKETIGPGILVRDIVFLAQGALLLYFGPGKYSVGELRGRGGAGAA
jgi:uncharacterized membrane protein YphA (DoxX/SURF4 family)